MKRNLKKEVKNKFEELFMLRFLPQITRIFTNKKTLTGFQTLLALIN